MRLSSLLFLDWSWAYKLSISFFFSNLLVDLTIYFNSRSLKLICCGKFILQKNSFSFLGNNWYIENLLHLIIEKYNLIILSNHYAIIVHLYQAAKHINQLTLLSCTLEIFSVSLIKSSSKKVNEQHGNTFV